MVGKHCERKYSAKGRIEITIKNQPFTPYVDEKGGNVSLHYIIEFKGNFTNWDNVFDSYAREQSNLEYTTIVLTYGEGSTLHGEHLGHLQGQIDFRVKAELGYWTRIEAFPDYEYSFTGEISDWSNIQTITISDSPTRGTQTHRQLQSLLIHLHRTQQQHPISLVPKV